MWIEKYQLILIIIFAVFSIFTKYYWTSNIANIYYKKSKNKTIYWLILGTIIIYININNIQQNTKNYNNFIAYQKKLVIINNLKNTSSNNILSNIALRLQSIVNHNPQDDYGWYLLAKIYFKQQNFALALNAIQHALTLKPRKNKYQKFWQQLNTNQ